MTAETLFQTVFSHASCNDSKSNFAAEEQHLRRMDSKPLPTEVNAPERHTERLIQAGNS